MDRRARSSLIFAVLVVLVVGFVLLVREAATGDPPAGGNPAATGDPTTGGDPPVSGEMARVVGVSDGDTIRVRLSDGSMERLRYIGIDAPELSHPGDGIAAECFGDESTAANRSLVAGREVLLERDESDRDPHGRLLRHVWVVADGAWHLVTEQLVEDGFAAARSYPPDTARDDVLAAAEEEARNASAGIWGSCG